MLGGEWRAFFPIFSLRVQAVRCYPASRVAVNPDFAKHLEDKMQEKVYSKRSPLRWRLPALKGPNKFLEAANLMFEARSYSLSPEFHEASIALSNTLFHRQSPLEKEDTEELLEMIRAGALESGEFVDMESVNNASSAVAKKWKSYFESTAKRLKILEGAWQPIDFSSKEIVLMYMYSRFVPEFAALMNVLNEIKVRDPDFVPKSMFDFGSGVGTAMWAGNLTWPESIVENVNVDVSVHMEEICRILMQSGLRKGTPLFSNVSHRPTLPSSNPAKYDLVTSAYSLLELKTFQERLQTLQVLWHKTRRYLVLVERGNSTGHRLLMEARDLLIPYVERSRTGGHLFSPCPHKNVCPKFRDPEGYHPCSFDVFYFPYSKGMKRVRGDPAMELVTFLIFKRGHEEGETQWPRVVTPVTRRGGITTCQLCASDAKLHRLYVTTGKYGMELSCLMRRSRSGDRLPVDVSEVPSVRDMQRLKEQNETKSEE